MQGKVETPVKTNKLISILRTLRNNWKKTTFGVILLGFGYDYAADKYRTHQFMRAYCEEARKYGEQQLLPSLKPRHVTVILNPSAKNGKGKNLYEKFSSPLLHLAGLKVSLIQTEQEGQARTLMEVMGNTDAVVVAGGDGTVHEAVTGLLRRNDEVAKTLPLGIAPIGKKNLFARRFFCDSEMTEARLLAESTMAVVRELQTPVDVIRVEGSAGKPVYAVQSIECGVYRDTDILIDKYWYYGMFKAKVAYFFSAIKGLAGNLSLSVSYVLPCSGCSRCHVPDSKIQGDARTGGSRWWHAFIPRSPSRSPDIAQGLDLSKVINENCGSELQRDIACSNFLLKFHKDPTRKAITAEFEEPLQGVFKFISDGWTRHSGNSKPPSESLEFREAEISIETRNDEERWLSIDNEKYEKQNVKITLLPSKVHMYVKQTKNE